MSSPPSDNPPKDPPLESRAVLLVEAIHRWVVLGVFGDGWFFLGGWFFGGLASEGLSFFW